MEFAGDYRNGQDVMNSIWQARTKAEARQIMADRRKVKLGRAMEAMRSKLLTAFAGAIK